MPADIRIGLIGTGKIARDQHIPVLQASDEFDLVATADPTGGVAGIANYDSAASMFRAVELDAIAICTPPQARFAIARESLLAGKHVLLEKPPCRSLAEFETLVALADAKQCTLFQTWHSRFAPGVQPAAAMLRDARVLGGAILWKEDARKWHPGQRWLWQEGGYGVFDPGINALSILTAILPSKIALESAEMFVPENCAAPIAAELLLRAGDADIAAIFDFRGGTQEIWDIALETDRGAMILSGGGNRLSVGGQAMEIPKGHEHTEYAALYRHFAQLIRCSGSDADGSPFRLVQDATRIGARIIVEAFHP